MQQLPASRDGQWFTHAGYGPVIYGYHTGHWTVGLETTPTAGSYGGGANRLVKVAQSWPTTSVDFYIPSCTIANEPNYNHAAEVLVRPWSGISAPFTPSGNGGVLAGFVSFPGAPPASPAETHYYLAVVNLVSQALELWQMPAWHPGASIETSFALIATTPAIGTWAAGAWFRVRIEIGPGPGASPSLDVTATPVTGTSTTPVSLAATFEFSPTVYSAYGVGAIRSWASFAYFRLERGV
jgi:hypothetical protein